MPRASPLLDIIADLNSRNPQAAWASGTVRGGEQQIGLTGFSVPWIALGIVAVLALVFACEQIFAVEPTGPGLRSGIRSLVAFGDRTGTS